MRIPQPTSLKQALLRDYLLLSSLPLLLIGVLFFSYFYATTLDNIKRHNRHLNQIIQGQLELFLNKPLANIDQLQSYLTEEYAEASLHHHLDNIVQNNRFFESILLVDQHGIVTAVGMDTDHNSTFEHELNGINLSRHPSFIQPRKQPQPWWSDAYLSLLSGRLSMTISQATADGQVVVGHFNVDQLQQLTTQFITNEGVTIAILDSRGTLLFHSQSQLAVSHPNLSNLPPIQAAIKGTGGTFSYRYADNDYLGSVSTLPDSGLLVLVSQQRDVAMAPLLRLSWLFALSVAGGTIIALLFAFYRARRINLPLGHFTAAAQRIKRGFYDIPIPDITIREFAEVAASMRTMSNAIQQREDDLNHLLGSTRAVPWRMEIATGRYVYIGPQLSTILGHKSDQWREQPLREALIHPDDRHSVSRVCQEAMQRGAEYQLEYRVFNTTGDTIWIHDVVSVEWTDGAPSYLVGFMIDITDRKQLESDLVTTLGNLDRKVQDRTQALQERLDELEQTRAELIQSEKMASLGRMVAGFAHEINTPIGIAVGGASGAIDATTAIYQLLDQEDVEEDELLRHLSNIKSMNTLALSSLRRAANLITSFKRTTIDQCSDQPRTFNLASTINDIVCSLSSTIFKSRPIEINVDLPAQLTINGLPGVIDQLISNLMINSLRYGFEEGHRAGTIQIKAILHGDSLTLIYDDSGVGMAADIVEHAFEPFFTTGRAIGGTGLGLYICYNLVTNQLGGTIHLTSAPNEGVHFEIRFPVTVVTTDEPQIESLTEPS